MRLVPPIKPIFCALFSLLLSASVFAQTSIDKDKGCHPPINRQRWHDDVDAEQKNALKASGSSTEFQMGNDQVTYHVTNSIIGNVDAFQCRIEKDSMGDQKKVGYLQGLAKLIRNFVTQYKAHQFNPTNFQAALDTYEAAMHKDLKGESIQQLLDKQIPDVANIIMDCGAFDNNTGYINTRYDLKRKYLLAHTDQIFMTLKDNPDLPFRDSLIKVAGHLYPRKLYDYAAADNKLGRAIRNINDSMIQLVVRMATDKNGSGQLYFPFFDDLLKGRQTIEEIDSTKEDPVRYYKLLVKTKLDYVHRMIDENEKITEMKSLDQMLQNKGVELFIKSINELHESPDAVRFKILNQLSAEELYFLIIGGEQDLYTSSYVRGVYPAMMQKINGHGDTLLLNVGFDHFKKFIKIAAGYNTLSNFLGSMPKENAAMLMTAFVNKLESSSLEDGVDVADSYASIAESIKPVADGMLSNVKKNLNEMTKDNNKRGMVIYDLLYKLFMSSTDSTIDLSKEFNIPPVYSVNYKALAGDSGKVVIQVFFYGDKDGRGNFANFVPYFPAKSWKRYDTKYWVSFTSLKGKPVVIYANRPLPEETGEVDKAQEELDQYLEDKGLSPTIIVHRGHSYYAPFTVDQIPPTAKIVFLGSCGGYNLINDILEHSADAHIIASKQTGKQVINQPFFNFLDKKLLTGNNIEWIPFWKEFEKEYGKLDGFGDYVPPHKNLGAIFIKAYKNAMGENVQQSTGM